VVGAAVFSAKPVCLGMDVHTFVVETAPPCLPFISPALVNRTRPHTTAPCSVLFEGESLMSADSLPYELNCADAGVLNRTSFRGPLDNALYLVELAIPGANQWLIDTFTGVWGFNWLAERAALHTTEAHEADAPRTAACNAKSILSLPFAPLFLWFASILGLSSAAAVATLVGAFGLILVGPCAMMLLSALSCMDSRSVMDDIEDYDEAVARRPYQPLPPQKPPMYDAPATSLVKRVASKRAPSQ